MVVVVRSCLILYCICHKFERQGSMSQDHQCRIVWMASVDRRSVVHDDVFFETVLTKLAAAKLRLRLATACSLLKDQVSVSTGPPTLNNDFVDSIIGSTSKFVRFSAMYNTNTLSASTES
jgi:hypothetical protein